jgi:hypothetical protein
LAHNRNPTEEKEQEMKISEFSNRRPSAKFSTLGDRVEGIIVEEPELQPDKFGNPGDKVLVLVLERQTVFARRQMLHAIGDAVSNASVDEIECGGQLAIEYIEDKPTGGGAAMKVYGAKYIPPSHLGSGVFGADDVAF